jgi:hypothetical protein
VVITLIEEEEGTPTKDTILSCRRTEELGRCYALENNRENIKDVVRSLK